MTKGLSINGLGKLQKKLKANMSMTDVKKVVRDNGAQLNAKAQRKAPVDTGFLRRSIIFQLSDGGLKATSTPMAEYAPYLEYGTRFISAQPFMRPAFNEQKQIFKRDMDRLVK
ncbi:HK97-gp10 family putative phage morphogenesis protein [Enterococcus avium]|uniref:HK97-gp10 family putative phage morphogenesis protein n=1 Tax=Enterococcus avium TaxID=33945 RepID=UPI001C11B2E3|nr:HK97-gp10 family putative phage morphogenesis protein [Enterococcus avium]MBU5370533.1 HK97 gp10 family phage protein [Enterococcus avium]